MPIPAERMYRHMLMIESLDQHSTAIAHIAESLWKLEDDRELIALHQAENAVRFAIHALQEAETEARSRCQAGLLTEQLAASVELIGRSPEQMRREQS